MDKDPEKLESEKSCAAVATYAAGKIETVSPRESKKNAAALRFEGTYSKANSAALIALLFVSVLGFFVSAILVVEAVFALAGIGEELIRKDDPVLGFRHRSNKAVTWRREGYSKAFLNADGLFEDITPGAHPGIYRVAVFGDSMVEGLQEPQEQGFVKLLEKQFQGAVPGKLQVMNCGVFGYSTVQACLYADEVIDKYQPDLVLFGYDTRDMAETVETWVPAGQKPLGGRPYAIKHKGQAMEISSAPVTNALDQDKNKFWAQFEWFQQNSRIWGYLTENRPKLSLHNALIDAIASFGKPADKQKKPSFSIKFFEQNKPANANMANSVAAVKPLTILENNQRLSYLAVLDDTFGELLARLKKHCNEKNAKLAVFTLPSRSDLLPDVGAVPALYGVTIQEEIRFIWKSCTAQKVPFVECHDAARYLSPSEQHKLFYVLHLTPDGHKYVADQMKPLVQKMLQGD